MRLRGKRRVVKPRMILIDTGIDDADLHAQACVGDATQRVPGGGSVDQASRTIQMRMPDTKAHHGFDARQTLQRGQLVSFSIHEDRVR